jgi:hypothetical protein
MRIKSCLLALLLAVTLCVSCAPKTKVDPSTGQIVQLSSGDQLLAGAKTFGKVLADSLDQGIQLEAALAENGTIDKDVEPKIRQWLLDGKKATADFNARIGKYDHIDADSKKVIADFIEEAIGFIAKMNNEGVLRIKNPKSQLIASGILLGAQTAVTVYKANFNSSP